MRQLWAGFLAATARLGQKTRMRSIVARAGILAGFLALVACKKSEAPKEELPTSVPSVVPSSASSLTSATAPAAEAPHVPKDANVILLSIDSLRADMPWAGYARPIAPRLTAFEKQSVSYTHAYSVSSYTSMSLGGLLGGRYPHELQRDGYFFGKYAPSNDMFPETLTAAGVQTLGAHAHGYFQNAGFEQGFTEWKIVPKLKWNAQTDENVTSPELEKIFEDGLTAAAAKGRFFGWVHFLDPHDMYMGHEKDGIEPFGKTARDKYDGEVLFTDRYVGKLLDFIDAAPWGKRTIVIVTADHGEAFGEHNQTRHGFEIWENLVRVPLMVRVPGVAPRHVDTPRSAIDVAPTILDAFGVERSPSLSGTSLVAEVLGKNEAPRPVVVDLPATSNNDRRRAVVSGKWKLTTYGQNELYAKLFDLEADPGEDHPITKGDDFDKMRAVYKEATAKVKDVMPTTCTKGCLEGTK